MRWTDINEIAKSLNISYPNIEPQNVNLAHLRKMTINLMKFNDDHLRSNERILQLIKNKWLKFNRDNKLH